MTKLLKQALRQVEKLSESEQDAAGAALMNAWRERALTLPRATSVPHVGEHRGRS